MTKAQAKKRIAQLREEIRTHRYEYHVLNKQSISDAALDSLKKELFDLEEEYPEFVTPDSPTQRVAGEPLAKFEKFSHPTRMLSLYDAFSYADLEKWEERLLRVDPDAKLSYYVEPKIDGLAMNLIYEHGVLTVAATRGDGRVGENVTENIKTIESVPLQLRNASELEGIDHIEVRGEVFMTKDTFDRINAQRKKAGEPEYMNPRNTAAGSIRQLDPSLVAERDLRFLAYSIPTDLGLATHEEDHKLLKKLGFYTDPDTKKCATLAAAWKHFEAIGKKRDSLPYLIDGAVVQVNDNTQFSRFGVVGKAPRGAIALKFPAEQATTIVEDIQVQIGRTGALTPVAHLRPVQVAGSTVSRATLHNVDEITRLGVKIGDTVIIEKAGDIIPDIVEVLPKLRTGKEKAFRMPRKCPACGSAVQRRDGEVAYYCTNTKCFGQQKERFYHFVSKKGMNIDGLGPKIIDQLLDEGLIHTPADLFELTVGDIEPLERFAEKKSEKIIENIDAARSVALHQLIFALGIRHVGEQTARVLAERFGTFAQLQKATDAELQAIHDIGDAAATSIIAYFTDKQTAEFLKQLVGHLTIQKPEKAHSQKLSGKTFVFTGTLESMTRDDAKALVRDNGGEIVSSVSSKLDYLVVGSKPGSKVTKAKKANVSIITEKEFLKMV